MANETINDHYQGRARRVARILAAVPFLRLVLLNGSVAQGRARVQSDIDFLVITVSGRMFTVRFLVTFIVRLLGVHRHHHFIAGRICLNRYQTTNMLTIEPRNRYHAEVFSQVLPLVDINNTYTDYTQANQWMSEFGHVPSMQSLVTNENTIFATGMRQWGEWVLGGGFGELFEKFLGRLQKQKIATNPLTVKYPDRIRVTDDTLLFHPPAAGEVDDDLARWDAAAAEYDLLQGTLGDPLRRTVLDPLLMSLLGDSKDKAILDAGCGNGYFTHRLMQAGARVIGIDGSSVMIARARQNFPNATYQVVDLHAPLPFANNSFDVIVATMVIQDLANPDSALTEFARINQSLGTLIVTIPHPCFAYPTTRARRGFFGRVFNQKPTYVVGTYQGQRRVTVPIAGLTYATARYHRMLTDYVTLFRQTGWHITALHEPMMPDLGMPLALVFVLENG